MLTLAIPVVLVVAGTTALTSRVRRFRTSRGPGRSWHARAVSAPGVASNGVRPTPQRGGARSRGGSFDPVFLSAGTLRAGRPASIPERCSVGCKSGVIGRGATCDPPLSRSNTWACPRRGLARFREMHMDLASRLPYRQVARVLSPKSRETAFLPRASTGSSRRRRATLPLGEVRLRGQAEVQGGLS
jgi:hypothetical protein